MYLKIPYFDILISSQNPKYTFLRHLIKILVNYSAELAPEMCGEYKIPGISWNGYEKS